MFGDKLLQALLPLLLAALVILDLAGAPPPCRCQGPDHFERLGNRGDTLRSGPIALGLRLPRETSEGNEMGRSKGIMLFYCAAGIPSIAGQQNWPRRCAS